MITAEEIEAVAEALWDHSDPGTKWAYTPKRDKELYLLWSEAAVKAVEPIMRQRLLREMVRGVPETALKNASKR